jgi:hypothetical protein
VQSNGALATRRLPTPPLIPTPHTKKLQKMAVHFSFRSHSCLENESGMKTGYSPFPGIRYLQPSPAMGASTHIRNPNLSLDQLLRGRPLGHPPLRYSSLALRDRCASTTPAARATRNAGIAVTTGQAMRARSHKGEIADVIISE